MNWRTNEAKVVNLKGNREAMMLAACEHRAELNWRIKSGGREVGIVSPKPAPQYSNGANVGRHNIDLGGLACKTGRLIVSH